MYSIVNLIDLLLLHVMTLAFVSEAATRKLVPHASRCLRHHHSHANRVWLCTWGDIAPSALLRRLVIMLHEQARATSTMLVSLRSLGDMQRSGV